MDGLKRLNDAHGHPAGDRALVQIAQYLGEMTREGDVVARIGGDEFAILLPRTDHAAVQALAARIEAGLPISWPEGTYPPVNCSIGVTNLLGAGEMAGERAGMDAERAMREADRALYRAKARHHPLGPQGALG